MKIHLSDLARSLVRRMEERSGSALPSQAPAPAKLKRKSLIANANDVEAKMRKMLKCGKSYYEIAEALRIHHSTCYVYATRLGLPIRRYRVRADKLNAERDRQIVRMRNDGSSYPAIGRAFGLSRVRVRRIVERDRHSHDA